MKIQEIMQQHKDLVTPDTPQKTSITIQMTQVLQRSPLLSSSPGGYETSVDGPIMESSVDPLPKKPASIQGEGLNEMHDIVKVLEEKYTKVEDKVKGKKSALVNRKTAIETYEKYFNTFHRELDHMTKELAKSQPVLNDDDEVKEQIKKTEVNLV